MNITAEREQDFWAQTERGPVDSCWEWRGSVNNRGRAVCYIAGRPIGAHRIAWCLQHELPLPSHHQVRRTCGNDLCVNPAHLKRVMRAAKTSAKGNGKSVSRILRPPKDRTQVPKDPRLAPPNKWSRARVTREFQGIKQLLAAQTAAMRQFSEIAIRNNDLAAKAKSPVDALSVRLVRIEETLGQIVAKIERLDERLGAPADVVADPVAGTDGVIADTQDLLAIGDEPDEPEPAVEDPPEPESANPEPEPEIGNPRFGSVLAQTYRNILDFGEVDDHGHEALEDAWAMLSADAEGNVNRTAESFAARLLAFKTATGHNPSADRGAAAFAKFAAAGQLRAATG